MTATSGLGIGTSAADGATAISLGDAVTGGYSNIGILSSSSTGTINIASTSTVTGIGDYAIRAGNNLATVTIGGDGVSSTATNARVKIDSATGIVAKNGGNGGNNGAVTVNTFGAVTSSGIGIEAANVGDAITIGSSTAISGTQGITATNTGTGTISIATGAGGTVAGTAGNGLTTSAATGATTIDLGANVSGAGTGAYGVGATASGAGDITIKTAAGVTVTGVTRGISATSAGGNIRIGDATTGLGGAVSGATTGITGTGIFASTTGTGKIDIKTGAGATVTGSVNGGTAGAINATSVNGDIGLDLGDTVRNSASTTGFGVIASATGSGSITLTGAGDVSSGGRSAIYAQTATGAVTIGGTGGATSSSSSSAGIYAYITNSAATSDILVNRSGALAGGYGVLATNYGSGKITIQGIGAVTATNNGINSQARSGATLIDLTNNVTATVSNTAGAAISATSTTGAITIKTASGVAISSDTTGIYASSTVSGNIDIGGTAGLGGAVSGRDGGAISATTAGAGTVTVKTASGGNLNGGALYAIKTSAVDGATTIAIGAGSTVTGLIQTTTTNGNVVANNAGTVNGSLNAVLSSGGTGTATFNNAGTLALTGTQANTGFALNNQSGGVLTGTGSFGVVNAASGSVIQAGDRTGAAGGTLTMSSLTMAMGAKLDVRVDATSGNVDKANVTGTATLNGGVLNVAATPNDKTQWASPISTKAKYTVLTAGTLSGAFDTVTTDLAFLKIKADYSTANQVDVTFDKNGVDYTTVAKTDNQTGVAKVLKAASDTSSLSANGQALIDKINGTVTQGNETKALDALSGSQTPILQSSALQGSNRLAGTIGNQALGALNGPGAAITTGGALAYVDDGMQKMAAVKATKPKDAAKPAPVAERSWRIWATTLGGLSETSSKNANPRVTGTDFGGVVGFDKVVAPGIIAGFAFGGTNSTSSVDNGATKGNVDAAHLSVYGVAESGPVYVSASLGYGRYAASSTRTVAGIGSTETWKGSYGANGYSGDVEVGYRYKVGAYQITPFAGLRYNVIDQESYSETSTDPGAVFGLSYGSKQTRSVPASLGVQAETGFGSNGGWQITGLSRLAWVHEFETSRSVSASFVNLPGSSFSSAGASADADLARLTAGLTLVNGKGSTLYTTLTGDFSDTTRAGTLQAGYKYQW